MLYLPHGAVRLSSLTYGCGLHLPLSMRATVFSRDFGSNHARRVPCLMSQILVSNTTPSASPIYDLVLTLALGLVTLTPKALALATISTLFREETACAISAAYV